MFCESFRLAKDRQTDRQTDRQRDRQRDRQTDRQTDGQTDFTRTWIFLCFARDFEDNPSSLVYLLLPVFWEELQGAFLEVFDLLF